MTSVARETVSGGPGDRSAAELCSSDDLARAWKTVVRGYTHVTDLLTEQVERETGLPAPAFFALVWLLRDGSGSGGALSMLAREGAFSHGVFTQVGERAE